MVVKLAKFRKPKRNQVSGESSNKVKQIIEREGKPERRLRNFDLRLKTRSRRDCHSQSITELSMQKSLDRFGSNSEEDDTAASAEGSGNVRKF